MPSPVYAALSSVEYLEGAKGVRRTRTLLSFWVSPLKNKSARLEGFSKRSKIDIVLELDPDLGRLPEDHELSLFRIAQECLTNIHRHSGSATADIRLAKMPGQIELEVKDTGRGIKKQIQSRINSGRGGGVGFRGMRERVKQIGGTLTIHSSENGTAVRVTLPVAP